MQVIKIQSKKNIRKQSTKSDSFFECIWNFGNNWNEGTNCKNRSIVNNENNIKKCTKMQLLFLTHWP